MRSLAIKMKAPTIVGRGKENLILDPGSKLRIYMKEGYENKGKGLQWEDKIYIYRHKYFRGYEVLWRKRISLGREIPPREHTCARAVLWRIGIMLSPGKHDQHRGDQPLDNKHDRQRILHRTGRHIVFTFSGLRSRQVSRQGVSSAVSRIVPRLCPRITPRSLP